jgi:hypothetical protein
VFVFPKTFQNFNLAETASPFVTMSEAPERIFPGDVPWPQSNDLCIWSQPKQPTKQALWRPDSFPVNDALSAVGATRR